MFMGLEVLRFLITLQPLEVVLIENIQAQHKHNDHNF